MNTVGLSMHFAPEGSCSGRSDVELCQLKYPKSASQTGPVSSDICCPFFAKNSPISSLSE